MKGERFRQRDHRLIQATSFGVFEDILRSAWDKTSVSLSALHRAFTSTCVVLTTRVFRGVVHRIITHRLSELIKGSPPRQGRHSLNHATACICGRISFQDGRVRTSPSDNYRQFRGRVCLATANVFNEITSNASFRFHAAQQSASRRARQEDGPTFTSTNRFSRSARRLLNDMRINGSAFTRQASHAGVQVNLFMRLAYLTPCHRRLFQADVRDSCKELVRCRLVITNGGNVNDPRIRYRFLYREGWSRFLVSSLSFVVCGLWACSSRAS